MTAIDREHESSTSTALRDLTAGVRKTLHEDTDTVGCSSRVGRGLTLRPDGGDIEPNASTTLHDLNLLLISEEDARVTVMGLLDHEAVREALELVWITDT
jgi:hypothetical protein